MRRPMGGPWEVCGKKRSAARIRVDDGAAFDRHFPSFRSFGAKTR
jgi:hypothetical protein